MARNPFDSAVRKGHDAFLDGKSRSACPYRDHRKEDGRLTFGRAWRSAWFGGYEQAYREAISSIIALCPVTIGSCSIGIDGQWLCVTDPYGCDRYFGDLTEENVRKAIDWAVSVESAPAGEHPAERNSSQVAA